MDVLRACGSRVRGCGGIRGRDLDDRPQVEAQKHSTIREFSANSHTQCLTWASLNGGIPGLRGVEAPLLAGCAWNMDPSTPSFLGPRSLPPPGGFWGIFGAGRWNTAIGTLRAADVKLDSVKLSDWSPSQVPFCHFFFGWEGSPASIEYRKKLVP